MKKEIQVWSFFVASILLFPSGLFAAAAGMFLVAEADSRDYVLLIRSREDSHFESPGGKLEKVSDLYSPYFAMEEAYEAALRETCEETRAYLGRRELILASDPENKLEYPGFTLFFARIDFFELDEIKKIRLPKGKIIRTWDAMLEVEDYAWVEVTAILGMEKLRVKDRSGREIKLHPMLQREAREVRQKAWLKK